MPRKRADELRQDVIESLVRLREEADDVLQRTRALCAGLDERLHEARRLSSRSPRPGKRQTSRRAS